MTEQPKNTDFHDSSFLQGANAAYVEQLYGQWARNPEAVDQAWDAFFRGLGDDEGTEHRAHRPERHRARPAGLRREVAHERGGGDEADSFDEADKSEEQGELELRR